MKKEKNYFLDFVLVFTVITLLIILFIAFISGIEICKYGADSLIKDSCTKIKGLAPAIEACIPLIEINIFLVLLKIIDSIIKKIYSNVDDLDILKERYKLIKYILIGPIILLLIGIIIFVLFGGIIGYIVAAGLVFYWMVNYRIIVFLYIATIVLNYCIYEKKVTLINNSKKEQNTIKEEFI